MSESLPPSPQHSHVLDLLIFNRKWSQSSVRAQLNSPAVMAVRGVLGGFGDSLSEFSSRKALPTSPLLLRQETTRASASVPTDRVWRKGSPALPGPTRRRQQAAALNKVTSVTWETAVLVSEERQLPAPRLASDLGRGEHKTTGMGGGGP